MKDVIKKLLTVKSIITLVLTGVFAYLAIIGILSADKVMEVYLIIVGFYFGTQSNKKENTTDAEI